MEREKSWSAKEGHENNPGKKLSAKFALIRNLIDE